MQSGKLFQAERVLGAKECKMHQDEQRADSAFLMNKADFLEKHSSWVKFAGMDTHAYFGHGPQKPRHTRGTARGESLVQDDIRNQPLETSLLSHD